MYETIRNFHLDFAEQRGLESTYCPSEVARACFSKDWRSQMDLVRQVADELVADEKLVVMQKGEIISAKAVDAKGAIRLRRK